MSWDRIQRMQLEQQQLEARFRAEIDQLSEQVAQLRDARRRLTEERDLARRVAVRLKQECHALAGQVCALCAQQIVPVHVVGEAR